MSYQASIIEIFLSSPDDVKAERALIIRTAAEWNQVRGRDTACFISILTWQEVVAPALMDRPQAAINDQVGGNYDVYLGVMWTKFGTSTGIAQSGTEEEFLIALEKHKSGDNIRVSTLFKTGFIDLSSVDATQLQKVQSFKKRISDEGVFYREFSNDNALKSILFLLFERIAKEKVAYIDTKTAGQDVNHANMLQSSNKIEESGSDGLIEIGEQLAEVAASLTQKLAVIMEGENEHTAEMAASSDELSRMNNLGFVDKAQAKRVFRRVAASMDALATKYAHVSPDIEADSSQIAQSIDADLRVRFQFSDWRKSGMTNLESAESLSKTMKTAESKLRELIIATESIPPLSGDVNKSKIKLIRERQRLMVLFNGTIESIDNSIEYFRGLGSRDS